MGKIHEAHPQHRTEPLCGLPAGKTRAGKPGLRVQCKNCLRLMASRKVIARQVALRQAERRQRQQLDPLSR